MAPKKDSPGPLALMWQHLPKKGAKPEERGFLHLHYLNPWSDITHLCIVWAALASGLLQL